jgi:perosamine synthetase
MGEEELSAIAEVVASGWLTTGPRVKAFEAAFAQFVGAPEAVALNSCTAARHLALEAIGLKEGEGVLVPTLTFAATAEVVRYFKAVPVLVDCRAEDLSMDVADAERRLAKARSPGMRVVAMIPMHYGGQIGDAAGLVRLAHEQNLKIVEDAAHCCPGKYRESETSPWQGVGSFSDVSCYSFYANKCITTGEGGMACTDVAEYADRMRIMSLHGISRDAWKRFTAEGSWYYEIVAPGFKYNLTDVAASIGIHQLRKADELFAGRRRVAETYARLLGDIEELDLPRELPNRLHSWHLYAIRLRLDRLCIDRVEFINALKAKGIITSVHWMPLHMHPYYRENYGYQAQDFPVAAGAYPGLVSLPIFPDMAPDQVAYVADAVREVIGNNRRIT